MSHRPSINTSVIERQMRRWELATEVHERVGREHAIRNYPAQVHPYIAIARQAGAQASTIARIVSERLGFELLDKEILDCMAEKYNLSKGSLRSVDEERTAWLREVFGHWIADDSVPQSQYVARLGEVVLLAARNTSAIFVGRGAHFYLPRDKGLVAYIIGPRDQRVARAMREHGADRRQGERYIDDKDRGRRTFVRNYFRRDVTDPSLYDLVLNTGRIPPDRVAEIIAAEFRARWPKEAAATQN